MSKKKTPEALVISREQQRVKAFDDFLCTSNIRYNNKFDYSKFAYIDAKTKGVIICPAHGEFLQNPDKHLHSKYGCLKCYFEIKRKSKIGVKKKRITKEIFLERANKKYNNKFIYDLTNFVGRVSDDKILVTCPIHGSFETTVTKHILNNNKYGCNNCAREGFLKNIVKSYDQSLEDFWKIHGNTYIYPESNRKIYINSQSRINIECKKHGIFIKKASKHLIGRGCERCMYDRLIQKKKKNKKNRGNRY